MALFGPAGIVASLASGSSGEGNRCLAAIEAGKRGVKPSGTGGVVETATEGARGVVTGAGRKLKKLFGR